MPRASQPRSPLPALRRGVGRGLVFAYNHACQHEAIGRLGAISDNGTVNVRRSGAPGVIGIQGSNSIRSVSVPSDSLLLNSGPVTHMGVVQITAFDANFGGLFSVSDGSSNATFSIQRQSTGTSLSLYRSAGDRWDFTAAVTALADSKLHVWCVVSENNNSGASTLYIDKTKYTGASTFAGGTQAGAGVNARFFSERSNNTAFGSDGHYYAHYAWNRVLTEPEIFALVDNPWQMYVELPARKFFGPAAAATSFMKLAGTRFSLAGHSGLAA